MSLSRSSCSFSGNCCKDSNISLAMYAVAFRFLPFFVFGVTIGSSHGLFCHSSRKVFLRAWAPIPQGGPKVRRSLLLASNQANGIGQGRITASGSARRHLFSV